MGILRRVWDKRWGVILTVSGILLLGCSWIFQYCVHGEAQYSLSRNLGNYSTYINRRIASYEHAVLNLLMYNHIYSGLWAQDIVANIDVVHQTHEYIMNDILGYLIVMRHYQYS